MKVSYVWWVVMPLAFWIAYEWVKREDYAEWWDWLDDKRHYKPSPLLNATWILWVKLQPIYEWVEGQVYRLYWWALRRGWVNYKRDQSWEDWCGRTQSPEELLLASIEWDEDPNYTTIRTTWAAYLKSQDNPCEALPPEDERAA